MATPRHAPEFKNWNKDKYIIITTIILTVSVSSIHKTDSGRPLCSVSSVSGGTGRLE